MDRGVHSFSDAGFGFQEGMVSEPLMVEILLNISLPLQGPGLSKEWGISGQHFCPLSWAPKGHCVLWKNSGLAFDLHSHPSWVIRVCLWANFLNLSKTPFLLSRKWFFQIQMAPC